MSTWLLQQDNDPCHKVGSMQALEQFNQHGRHHVQLLRDWPPNSPDLSPIENLWGILQRGILQSRVNRRGCETFQQFKAAVFEEWERVDLPLLQSLMGSMHSRMRQCIEANGGKIDY
jgi:DDE superfamily endonuclease